MVPPLPGVVGSRVDGKDPTCTPWSGESDTTASCNQHTSTMSNGPSWGTPEWSARQEFELIRRLAAGDEQTRQLWLQKQRVTATVQQLAAAAAAAAAARAAGPEGEGGEGGGESEAPEHSQDPPPSPPPLLPPSPPPPKFNLAFKLDSDGCVISFDPSVDYYPVERRAMVGGGASTVHENITFAKDFTITYYRTYKVLKNIRSTKSYILQQCGTPDEYPGLPDEAENATVFKVPLKKWSSGLTTSYTFMGKLGLWPQAVVVDAQYMSSPCGRKLVDCGVISAPEPPKNWKAAVVAKGSQVHFTDYLNTFDTGLHIDVAFDASSDPGVSSASPMHPHQSPQTSPPHFSGLLGRAEWIKFAAPFFNKEPEANSVFNAIESRFDAVVKDVETAARGKTSPRVAFITTFGSPGGVISIAAFKQEIVAKAGGTNVDPTIAETWCPLDGSTGNYKCANATAMKEVSSLESNPFAVQSTSSAPSPPLLLLSHQHPTGAQNNRRRCRRVVYACDDVVHAQDFQVEFQAILQQLSLPHFGPRLPHRQAPQPARSNNRLVRHRLARE